MHESLFDEKYGHSFTFEKMGNSDVFIDSRGQLDPSFFRVPQTSARGKKMSKTDREEERHPSGKIYEWEENSIKETSAGTSDEDFVVGRRDMQEIFENYNDSNFQIHYFKGPRGKRRSLRQSLGISDGEEILVDYSQKRFLRETATVVLTSKGVYIDDMNSPVRSFQYKDIMSADSEKAVVKLKGGNLIAVPRPVIPQSTWESFFIFLQMCGEANNKA